MSTLSASGRLTPAQFVAKWSRAELSERQASQEHFIDLCRMLGQPTPAEHDAAGADYAFEKGVATTAGASKGSQGASGGGFADVWWRGKFGWEYKRKGKHKTLDDAYRQLLQYREALENPPLLIVSDIARTEIHTNFTGTAKQVHAIPLDRLAEPEHLDKLRRVFTDPHSFKPAVTPAKITEEVAEQFASLAQGLRERGHDPHDAAHSLMRCMFCLFAEDVALLPERLFSRLLAQWHDSPQELTDRLSELFEKMRTGGAFGFERIPWFNGGLFDQTPALPLTTPEIGVLMLAAKQDWSSVEPAIFGTLFERSLDPSKRAQIGAHYTSREDILLIVEPVVMAPLRREWAAVKAEVEKHVERRRAVRTAVARRKADEAINATLQGFLGRLASVRVLDPACGSGNFLYVAIQQLLDLEKEVLTFAAQPEIGLGLLPRVRPTQLHGIEINPYAAELAQVVIWIGYLQWMRDNGFNAPRDPILEPLQTIENRDAILAWEDEDCRPIPQWREGAVCRGPAEWPVADLIIGNPPFLGSSNFRASGIPDSYKAALERLYTLRGKSDLCCCWFEKARLVLTDQPAVRVGLLGNTTIRFGVARDVLDRIKQTGDIFNAWSNREWVNEGASVRVCMVCFDHDQEQYRTLDGRIVTTINADLTASVDVTQARRLSENGNLSFEGDQKGGPFDIDWVAARQLLAQPNPTPQTNAEVLTPRFNAMDITRRWDGGWIIDFGTDRSQDESSRFAAPFAHLEAAIQRERAEKQKKGARLTPRKKWWLHKCPRPELRRAVADLSRQLVTPRVAKHRLFVWLPVSVLPDSRLFVFARGDDYFFGALESSVHQLWSLSQAPPHGVGNDPTYSATRCFETFPLPWPPSQELADHPAHRRISEAARELNEQRERWLNPPEWIEPLAKQVDAADDFADVPAEARPLIRQSAIMALAAKDPRLKKRTLTNLYNERPTWLKVAHEKLDRAVLAAYAATDPAGEWAEDWAEVWRDAGAGQPLPQDHPLGAKRAEVDQRVLANLLRMNLERRAG